MGAGGEWAGLIPGGLPESGRLKLLPLTARYEEERGKKGAVLNLGSAQAD